MFCYVETICVNAMSLFEKSVELSDGTRNELQMLYVWFSFEQSYTVFTTKDETISCYIQGPVKNNFVVCRAIMGRRLASYPSILSSFRVESVGDCGILCVRPSFEQSFFCVKNPV